jgi:MFS family permease
VNVLGMVIVISVVGKAGMVNVEKSESAGSLVQSWLAPWKIPDFRWVWFTRFLNSAALSPIMSFALYYLQKNIGLTKDEAGSKQLIIAVLLSLIAGISAFATGGLADKWGRKAVVYRSGFVMFTGVLIYAFVPNMSAVWLAVAIFGMGYGAYIGADWALASDIMPNKEDFARDMGMWSMSVPLGQAATGWLFGWIVQVINGKDGTMGYPVLWIICAVIFLFSATLVKKIQGST